MTAAPLAMQWVVWLPSLSQAQESELSGHVIFCSVYHCFAYYSSKSIMSKGKAKVSPQSKNSDTMIDTVVQTINDINQHRAIKDLT